MIDVAREEALFLRFLEMDPSDQEPQASLRELALAEFPLMAADSVDAVVDRLNSRVSGLGVLDQLLRDPSITDVLINGPGTVYVERDGQLQASSVVIGEAELRRVLERAFARNGLSLDRAHPIGDTRLPGGERLSAVLDPVAVDGVHVAIRRFAKSLLTLEDFGPPDVVEVLSAAVVDRKNIVVFGSTGAGKTSLVNALAGSIGPSERVVTIEDAAELSLGLGHVVRLECRPTNGEGAGRIDMRSLVRAALRLRPDRIIVGEVRGSEALDMVWALSTGHEGSISTVHAKSAGSALARLETFVMLGEAALPYAAVRAQVRSAIDLVVGLQRRGATREVVTIDQVIDDPRHPTGVETVVAR